MKTNLPRGGLPGWGKQALSLRTAWRGGERVPAATKGFRGSVETAAALVVLGWAQDPGCGLDPRAVAAWPPVGGAAPHHLQIQPLDLTRPARMFSKFVCAPK